MKHVTILIPRGHASIVNIGGTHQIFSMVNQLLEQRGTEPVFNIELAGLDGEIRQTPGIFSITPTCTIHDIDNTDLIIIPAIHDDLQTARELNGELIPWIVGQHRNGAEVASLCVAAFFLASTGLLDGKRCSTHWMHASRFRELFPEVILVDESIMTEQEGIYTSGGAYAFLNLLLYLIEKSAGREIAIHISKAFSIDMDRDSQSPFIMFEGQKEHLDDLIREVQAFIEQNFPERFSVEELASRFAVSRRTLERRFKHATGNTVIEYIQRVKVEAAKKEFESSRKSVSEVMFDVGYSDEKSFRQLFKRNTGLTPVRYKRKFSSLAG